MLQGAPGAGKTSLLKVIAGRHRGMQLQGSVTYNGLSAADVGPRLGKLSKFVRDTDEHMALLTVKETLEYAEKFTNLGGGGSKVESVISALQLDNCKDTFVGSEFVRGISGGEKKRVTLAEQLVTAPRVLCADQYTSGLDSSTAFAITVALQQW